MRSPQAFLAIAGSVAATAGAAPAAEAANINRAEQPGFAAAQAGQILVGQELARPFMADMVEPSAAERPAAVKRCLDNFYNRVFTDASNSGISYSVSTPRYAEVTVDPKDDIKKFVRSEDGGNSPFCASLEVTRSTIFRVYKNGRKIGSRSVLGGNIDNQEAPVLRNLSTKVPMRVGNTISAKLISTASSEGVSSTGYNKLSSTRITRR